MEHINNEGLQYLINKMADQLLTITVLEKTIKDLEARNKQLEDQVFRLNNELQDRIYTTIVNMERLRAHELSDELYNLKKDYTAIKEENSFVISENTRLINEINELKDLVIKYSQEGQQTALEQFFIEQSEKNRGKFL